MRLGRSRGDGVWCQMFCSSLSMLHVACARQMQLKRLSVAHAGRAVAKREGERETGMHVACKCSTCNVSLLHPPFPSSSHFPLVAAHKFLNIKQPALLLLLLPSIGSLSKETENKQTQQRKKKKVKQIPTLSLDKLQFQACTTGRKIRFNRRYK